jgi:putative tricarboxylic transport membrane protein
MRTADLVTALALMLLGGVVLYDAARLGIGWSTDGPRSGFFPFWLGLLLVLTCAAIVVQALRRRGAPVFVTRAQLVPVAKVLGPALALVVVMQAIGLYVASAFYLGLYMRWVGGHSWRAVAALGLSVPVIAFLIFERWFLVPMPKGPLEAWLGY